MLCPGSSDINLLGYGKSVIDFNAKIPHRAFDFLCPILLANCQWVNEGCLGSA